MSDTSNQDAVHLIIQQVISAWDAQNKQVTGFFDKYDDEAYLQPVAAGRNRAVYLLGHLVAVSDGMLPIMGITESLYPELESIFLTSPDGAVAEIPSVSDLKRYWQEVNAKLSGAFQNMQPQDWLERHTRVSEEDFVKNRQRNKLNIVINRTNHTSYHMGQLNFFKAV